MAGVVPPDILRTMRDVSNGFPAGAGWEWLDDLKKDDPGEFQERLWRYERDWSKREAAVEGSGGPEVGEDEGTERCVEMVRQLLGGGDGPGEA